MRKEQYDDLATFCMGVVNEVDRWITEWAKEEILEPGELFEIPQTIKSDIAGLVAASVGEALVRHGPKQRDHHGNLLEALNRVADESSETGSSSV